MECLLALAPDLDIGVSDFVAAWNDDPASRALARAGTTGQGVAFDPSLGVIALSAASTIALGVLTNFLTDWIKAQVAKRRPASREQVQVIQVRQPDGTPILVVTVLRDS